MVDEETSEVFHHVVFFVNGATGLGVVAVTSEFPESATDVGGEEDSTLAEGGFCDEDSAVEFFGCGTDEEVVRCEAVGDGDGAGRGVFDPRCGFELDPGQKAPSGTNIVIYESAEDVRVAGVVDFVTDDWHFQWTHSSEHDSVRLDRVSVNTCVKDTAGCVEGRTTITTKDNAAIKIATISRKMPVVPAFWERG